MNLRPYQVAAVDAVEREFADGRKSTLLVLPTGCGKTVVFSHIAHRVQGGRVLVIAHREELIRQAANKIASITGEPPEIEMAAERADLHMFRRAKVVVASKDTLRGNRLLRFDPREFRLVITDEAHHAVADSYGSIYDHFEGVPHLGVTATPDRHDEAALGRRFESVAFNYEIQDAIRDGWLVNVRETLQPIEGLDYSGVRTTAGDLKGKDLADVMNNEEVLQPIAEAAMKHARWRKALVFAPPGYKSEGGDTCRVSERLVEILNRRREGCARLVTGETPKDERRQILADFAEKPPRFQFLVNVGVFTEGFDDPSIELVVMARATKSRALYAQMVGRGTRPLPGIVDGVESAEDRLAAIARSRKPFCEVLGFEGTVGRHKLVGVADILGGDYSDDELEAVQKMPKSDRANVMEMLDEARRKLKEAKEAERQRRRFIVGQASLGKAVTIDPFDMLNIEPPSMRGWDRSKPVTQAQRDVLEKNGIAVPETMRCKEASALIEEIFRRRRDGLPTFKQTRALARRGLTASTFAEARALLDELSQKEGWNPRQAVSS